MQFSRLRIATVTITSVLFMALLYLSFRYPFKINSTRTSPTYSDTPFWLQGLKYVLFAAILVMAVVVLVAQRRQRSFSFRPRLVFVLVAFVLIWPALQIALGGPAASFQVGVFMALPVLLLSTTPRELSLGPASLLLRGFFWVALCVEAVQLLLFITVGRLPALGWPHSYSVRFGSLWDDPNGFGMFLAFLIPFMLLSHTRRLWKVIAMVGCIVMLVLTQSVTAIAAVAVALLICATILWRSRPRRLLAVWISAAVALGLVVAAGVTGLLARFVSDKSSSVTGHLNSLQDLRSATFFQYLGVDPARGIAGESGWVNLLTIYGVPFAAAFATIIVMTAFRCYRLLRLANSDRDSTALFSGILVFLVAFLIGESNLPLEQVFPVNALLAVFVAIVWVFPARASEHQLGSGPNRSSPATSTD